MKKLRVVMLGSGNVATSLAMALKDNCEVVQIYSRSIDNARELAQKVDCEAINDMKKLDKKGDIYIISVKDDAIASVIGATPNNGALWLHTSGSTPIEVFKGKRERYGVFYPMQSFSKSRIVDMSEVHIFIEGNSDKATREINDFASCLSENVHKATSQERQQLHVAAVFACNFANHMFTLASEVLHEAGLPFDAMLPLIKSTIAKLDHMTPQASQTGPAARGDTKIIEKHLSSLNGDKREIYRILSESILRRKGFTS